jgi:hypothetical protein
MKNCVIRIVTLFGIIFLTNPLASSTCHFSNVVIYDMLLNIKNLVFVSEGVLELACTKKDERGRGRE